MALVFRPRRGMKSTMAGDKATLVLKSGELFLEYPDTGVGTGASRFKIGDGTTEYSDLPYATPFIFTIQKNGSTVNPNANGVVNLTIGTADVSGLQSALDGKLSTTGNAASASKLKTARAITLAGDVTGTANFDGSAGITINATVKDDSHNHTIANVDGLQTALNGKLSTSGNAASASKWATARNINGLSVDGTANRVNFGTCSTAAGTAAKTVDCAGFSLVTGAEITVKFTVTNSAANPTLNVNNTGAKAIYYRGGAISAGYLAANRTYTFRYNGTQYDLVGDIDTSRSYSLSSFGITATAAELNKLDGATVTVQEINYLDGVTSSIQSQLNGKAASSHTHTTAQVSGLGAAATKAVTDSTSAAAIGTGSNLVTERDVYYGLPKINNAHSYTSNTNIFAPTTGGSSGQVLRSNGSTATPTWANAADLISTLDCGDEG